MRTNANVFRISINILQGSVPTWAHGTPTYRGSGAKLHFPTKDIVIANMALGTELQPDELP